jgi:hypothetical protein
MLTVHPAARGSFPTYSVFAENLEELVEMLVPPCPRFVLRIAADTEGASGAELQDWAKRVLDLGATYVCSWGPGADARETAFDLAAIERETQVSKESVIMTTAHADEPLCEAAWAAVHAALPDAFFEPGTEATILAAVGNPDWHRELVRFLDDGAPIPDAV